MYKIFIHYKSSIEKRKRTGIIRWNYYYLWGTNFHGFRASLIPKN